MQAHLISMKNGYEQFAVAVEKLYDTPDVEGLLVLIRSLERECGEYIKALVA